MSDLRCVLQLVAKHVDEHGRIQVCTHEDPQVAVVVGCRYKLKTAVDTGWQRRSRDDVNDEERSHQTVDDGAECVRPLIPSVHEPPKFGRNRSDDVGRPWALLCESGHARYEEQCDNAEGQTSFHDHTGVACRRRPDQACCRVCSHTRRTGLPEHSPEDTSASRRRRYRDRVTAPVPCGAKRIPYSGKVSDALAMRRPDMPRATPRFYAELNDFLPPEARHQPVLRSFNGRPSI